MRRRLSSSGTCRGRGCASSSRGGRTKLGTARRVVSGCRRNCVESASSSRPCTTTPLPFSRRAPTCTTESLPVSARAHLRLVHVVPYSDHYHPRSQANKGGERLPTRHGVDEFSQLVFLFGGLGISPARRGAAPHGTGLGARLYPQRCASRRCGDRNMPGATPA